mgnify:FL=1
MSSSSSNLASITAQLQNWSERWSQKLPTLRGVNNQNSTTATAVPPSTSQTASLDLNPNPTTANVMTSPLTQESVVSSSSTVPAPSLTTNVAAIQAGLDTWSKHWRQTVARLHSHSPTPSPPPLLENASHIRSRQLLLPDGAAPKVSAVNNTHVGTAKGNAADRDRQTQLLLRDIAEQGTIAKLELEHKKQTADLEHALRSKIMELERDNELAQHKLELQQEEMQKQRKEMHGLHTQLTRQSFDLTASQGMCDQLKLELESLRKDFKPPQIDEMRREQQLSRHEDCVSAAEHRRLKASCESLDTNIEQFRNELQNSKQLLDDVRDKNRLLEQEK